MNKTDIKQIIIEEIESALDEMRMDPAEKEVVDTFIDDYEGDIDDEDVDSFIDDVSEMARTSNVFKLKGNFSYKDVLGFMLRVNNILKTYKSPGQKRPKARFTQNDMKKLAAAITSSEGFTSKDIRLAIDAYNTPAQANKFLKALEMKGYIELISQLKKAMEPTRDPNAPETRGRKRRDAEFDMSDDPMADLDALGLGGSIDLSDPLAENNNTMSELEKYIKKVIKEAKNPLAKKMKEIEIQGRRAALETKLSAIDEMIEETQGRLTRIDEDNEFRDMMDKNAVKEVRKQLKELERAKAKLQKEMVKVERVHGGKKKKEVVDEDLPVEEDAVENAVDEVELEEDNFKLNESTLRFQKLAGLITESDIKKKLSLNESREKLMSMLSGVAKDMVEDGSLLPKNPGGGPFNVTGDSEGFEPRQIAAHNQIKNAVKKLGGSVNYKVDGLSFTYMVKGDDLFVRTDD